VVINPFFPRLRSGHRLFQRPSSQKQFLSSHERHAKLRLKPNGFGTIRKDDARDSQERALAVRSQANQQLAACRAQLLTQLHEASIVADDFRKLHEHRVALTLEKTVRTIAARRIPGGEFHPSFADKNNLGKAASKSTLSANHLRSKSS
jgi:hypothetical protein